MTFQIKICVMDNPCVLQKCFSDSNHQWQFVLSMTVRITKLLWFLELPYVLFQHLYVKLLAQFINVPFTFVIIFLVNCSADKNRCSTESIPAFTLGYETVHFLVKPNGFISVAEDFGSLFQRFLHFSLSIL